MVRQLANESFYRDFIVLPIQRYGLNTDPFGQIFLIIIIQRLYTLIWIYSKNRPEGTLRMPLMQEQSNSNRKKACIM